MQRAIEAVGIPTVLIAALPPVARQQGTPRAVAPMVPMGANAGAPHNNEMQRNILLDALKYLKELDTPGQIIDLPYEYKADI